MSTHDRGLASLLTWSRVARAAIVLFLLAVVVLFAVHVLVLIAELRGDLDMGIGAYNPVVASVLVGSNFLLSVVFLLAAMPILGWVYRAHANLRAAGVSELNYSPGWSVVCFFVPLINFVVPFRAMRELHNRSHGEGPWQAEASVADVASWWSCHIAALAVAAVAVLVALLATIPNLYVIQPPGVNTGLMLFALLLLTGSGWFLFRTIGAVTRAQLAALHLSQGDVFA